MSNYQRHKARMAEALKEAQIAFEHGETPVGAVVFVNDRLVGRGHNALIANVDVTAHAEIQALRSACQKVGNYRLPNSILYATLEPCIMCAGAILHARVEEVVFAAREPLSGAAGSVTNVLESDWLNHRCKVIAGVGSRESRAMLQKFFESLRHSSKSQ